MVGKKGRGVEAASGSEGTAIVEEVTRVDEEADELTLPPSEDWVEIVAASRVEDWVEELLASATEIVRLTPISRTGVLVEFAEREVVEAVEAD